MNKILNHNLIWPAVFIAASIAASFIRFTPFLVGKLNFTMFDLYAPIAGGLFGSTLGALTVFSTALMNLIIQHAYNPAAFLHLIPVIFGAWYFGTNKKLIALVPLLAILAFWVHPIGRAAWYYPLLWIIPVLCVFFKDRSVIANALGATLTSHAVGGVLWLFFFSPPPAFWVSLIPVVIIERLIFTAVSVIMYALVKKGIQILKLYKLSTIK
jgi:hypothetical protein